MIGKTLLLCSQDAALRCRLSQALACTGSTVIDAARESDARGILEAQQVNLVIVDVSDFEGGLGLLDSVSATMPSIAITSGHDLETLNSLVCQMGVSNVMARPAANAEGDDLTELFITSEKLLRNDLFGLDKYLHGVEAQLTEALLTHAGQRVDQLERLCAFLDELKVPRHLKYDIKNAADEMLTNAMFNAPVDARGAPRYASASRRTKMALDPREQVTLSYGVHDGMFGLCVADQFGRLRMQHLSSSIERCTHARDPIDQADGGAGLGLFLIARTAHQFIINVEPNKRTEVIALWNLERKKRVERRAHHSLHFFMGRSKELSALAESGRSRRRAAGTRSPTLPPTSDWDEELKSNPGVN